jgi:transposase
MRRVAAPKGSQFEPFGNAASSMQSWIPLEKKRFRPSEQSRPDVQARREAFVAEVANIDVERLIFIDESGCNRSMALSYGRAKHGQRVYDRKPAHKGENFSIVGAVRADRILCHQTVQGSVNGPRFVEFIERRLCPRLYPGDVVVMDNLRLHHAPIVRELIEDEGAQLIFLPPYSPEFSPIEPCWSFVKHQLRKFAHRTNEDLRRGIRNALLRVRSEHLANWFRHCGYNQPGRSRV